MKTYMFPNEISIKDTLFLKSLFTFEDMNGVFVFDNLRTDECSLIEDDFNLKMTVIFNATDIVLDHIKDIPRGYYEHTDYIVYLYENGIKCNLELSHELRLTANTFLEHNKSITKASIELYVHRNTLNYRLDRILNITGLDLKTFKGAFVYYLINFVHLSNSKE